MRETRQSGSEGGGDDVSPYPYHDFPRCQQQNRGWPVFAGHDTGAVQATMCQCHGPVVLNKRTVR